MAMCGLVTCPVLLLAMNLTPSERTQVVEVLVAAAALLPISLLVQLLARRCAVPGPLVHMTGGGWECREVRELSHEAQVDWSPAVECFST